MKKIFLPVSIMFASAAIFSACSKSDAPAIPSYTVPETYEFDNADYTEATVRINMWSGLTAYLGKSASRQLSQDTVNYLWNNTNSAFTGELLNNLPNNSDALNNAGFNLAAKTEDAPLFKAYIDSMVIVSASNGGVASEGVPGKIGNRLFNYSGLEFNQAVAKGLMGAMQMALVIDHLNNAAAADNNTVTPGKGTTMQHEWDMAFGYTAIPKNYDSSISYTNTVTDRPLALGGYFRERGRYIQAGGKIYEAFRSGRAAIAAKDYAIRDKAIATIREYLEKMLAAACYEYTAVGMTGSDLASKFHGLSEGYGFALALKYRQAGSKLTDANFQMLLNIFKTNFYELNADASNTKLKQAQAILTTAYGQLQP